MGALYVVRGVAEGLDLAGGNTAAAGNVESQFDRQRQQQGDQIKFALAPLSQALQADQTRLALYANPDDPAKALPGKEKEYQETLDRMTGTIGQMRTVLGQKQPNANPVEAGAGDLLAKLHITNHLKNHVAQVRKQDADKYATQNRSTAQSYATGALPYSMTPEGQAEAVQSADALRLAEANKTEQERFVTDYKNEHKGATTEEALRAYTAATNKTAPKGLKALEQGGVAYGVENQDTGQQYLPSQLGPNGDAPPEAKQIWATIKLAQADKLAQEQKKEDEIAQRQARTIAAGFERMGQSQQFQELMAQYRSDLQTYRALNTQADQSEETVAALKAQYAQPGNHSVADNELQNFYTTVVQKGGRKTAAELNLTLKIGSFGMNLEQMAAKAARGELPPELRQMLLDGMESVAKEQRSMAEQSKPELPEIPTPEGPKTKAIKKAKNDPLGVL